MIGAAREGLGAVPGLGQHAHRRERAATGPSTCSEDAAPTPRRRALAAAGRSSRRACRPRTSPARCSRRDPGRAVLDPHARRRGRLLGRQREPAALRRSIDRGRTRSSASRSEPASRRREPIPPTIEWRDGAVRLLDQRALPARVRFVDCRDVDAARATRSQRSRCAARPRSARPGAYGVALAARTLRTKRQVRAAAARIAATRPTAVNLAWGVDARARRVRTRRCATPRSRPRKRSPPTTSRATGASARTASRSSRSTAQVLTHCNTGALACVGYGTALGVVRAAVESGTRAAGVGRRDATVAAGRAAHDVGAATGSASTRRSSPTARPRR